MPKRSGKFRAAGTEANLLPRPASRRRDLPTVSDKNGPESSSDEFTGNDEEGNSFSTRPVEAVESIWSVTRADGAAIALIDATGLICRASSGRSLVHGFSLLPVSPENVWKVARWWSAKTRSMILGWTHRSLKLCDGVPLRSHRS